MMKKKVNIDARIPVRTLKTPIYGTLYNVEMDVKDIFKCICGRALVDEILTNGSLLRLNLTNYDKDNNPVVEVKKEEPVAPPTMKVKENIPTDIDRKVDTNPTNQLKEPPLVEETTESPIEENAVEAPQTDDEIVNDSKDETPTEDKPTVENTPAKSSKPNNQQRHNTRKR